MTQTGQTVNARRQEADDLFAQAFLLIPDCVLVVRFSDLTVLRANDAVCRLWGQRSEDVTGKAVRDFVTWDNEEEGAAFRRKLFKNGECLNHEAILKLNDGRRVPFSVSSRTLVLHGETCVLTVLRDLSDRREAQQAAAKIAAIVTSSDDAIIGKDLNSVITNWNPAAERIFGYTAAEMVGASIIAIIPPERRGEEARILAQVIRGESVKHFETVRVRKDGSLVDLSVTISPIRSPDGRVVGASKIARDITERKFAEQALRDSERRVRLATETTGVGIWEWNVVTNTIHWDAQMFRIYGVEPTADGMIEYRTWQLRVQPEDLAGQEQILQDTVRRSGHSVREFRIRRLETGEIRVIRAVEAARTDDRGQTEWIVGTNLDITQSKRAEEALRESEVRFRTMANCIPQLAWTARADGYITWYNRRWYEYTGTTLAEMEGWGWQVVHDPKVLPEVMARWKATIDAGLPLDMEFPLRGADGCFRTFLTRVEPLKDASGHVVQWFGTNTDVEAIKQAEEKVHRLNAELEKRVIERTSQLEAANQELEAFSYSVSHDLRAPLRAIDGFSKAVIEDYGAALPKEGQRDLDVIRTSAQRMGALIDDLLAFARLSQTEIDRQVVDTDEQVRSTLRELGGPWPDRQVELIVGTLPTCSGDPALLRQVWINLLSNALKYSRKRERAVIEVGCVRLKGCATFFVRDNGSGFDMRYAHKLFSVFQRLHRVEDYEGTGVGLAIVQRIVRRHGGEIWAESVLDQGATFFFTLEPVPPS